MVFGTVLDVNLDIDLGLLLGMSAWNYYPIRGGVYIQLV